MSQEPRNSLSGWLNDNSTRNLPGISEMRPLVIPKPKARKIQWEGPVSLWMVVCYFILAWPQLLLYDLATSPGELAGFSVSGFVLLLFFILMLTLNVWISLLGIRRGNWWNRILSSIALLLFILVVVSQLPS
jgi:hypothetical protein